MNKKYWGGFLSLCLIGLFGCGGSSSSSSSSSETVQLTTTVTLPTSSTSALQTLTTSKEIIKGATTESTQANMTATFYDEKDKKLGECTTTTSGTCTVAAALDVADHNIFVVVKNKAGTELAGSMLNTTVAADTSKVETTVNSEQSLAYDAYRAACEKQLGTACKPGENMSAGIAKVVPSCIKDAMLEFSNGDDTTAGGGATSGTYMAGLLEAKKKNFTSGAPVDMVCVMKGDAACQQSLGNTVGSEITALTLGSGKTITTADAASTATSMLNAVVDSLCGKPTDYATIKADTTYKAAPGDAFKMFEMMKPAEFTSTSFDATIFNTMLKAAPGVGTTGFGALNDPLRARAMYETFKAGGLPTSIDATEMAKRMGVIMGAPPPSNLAGATDQGRATFNIYGATNWAGSSAADAVQRFGPLMNADFVKSCIDGGTKAFDNYIDAKGGVTGFRTAYDSAGDPSKYFTQNQQVGIGEACTSTFNCLPPFSCSAAGKCSLGSTSTSFTGGFGTTCTANAQCASAQGFVCDAFSSRCVYAAGQASGGTFAVGGGTFTPPTSGAVGASCTSSTQCSGGRRCINGGCFDAPTGGFTGGAPLDSICSSNTQCASANCAGGKCVVAGGAPNGASCTAASQCTSTNCSGNLCVAAGTTFTAFANGSTCSSGAQCSSGNCTSAVCAAATTSGSGSPKANGEACTANSGCQSTNCIGAPSGTCQAAGTSLKANGVACSSPSECQSTTCIFSGSTGTCQAATTLKANGQPCTANTQCVSNKCTSTVCSP